MTQLTALKSLELAIEAEKLADVARQREQAESEMEIEQLKTIRLEARKLAFRVQGSKIAEIPSNIKFA